MEIGGDQTKVNHILVSVRMLKNVLHRNQSEMADKLISWVIIFLIADTTVT